MPSKRKWDSELSRFCRFELELQFICDEGDELGIGGLALGVGHGVAEKALQGIQIPPIPGHLDGMADGALHPGGRGLECFRHLGVQYLRDGVDVLVFMKRFLLVKKQEISTSAVLQ